MSKKVPGAPRAAQRPRIQAQGPRSRIRGAGASGLQPGTRNLEYVTTHRYVSIVDSFVQSPPPVSESICFASRTRSLVVGSDHVGRTGKDRRGFSEISSRRECRGRLRPSSSADPPGQASSPRRNLDHRSRRSSIPPRFQQIERPPLITVCARRCALSYRGSHWSAPTSEESSRAVRWTPSRRLRVPAPCSREANIEASILERCATTATSHSPTPPPQASAQPSHPLHRLATRTNAAEPTGSRSRRSTSAPIPQRLCKAMPNGQPDVPHASSSLPDWLSPLSHLAFQSAAPPCLFLPASDA